MRTTRFGIINRVPKSVEKPKGITLNSITILISMPTIVSMCPILYVKNCMSKAGFSKCWVHRLWLCVAAIQIMFRSDLATVIFDCLYHRSYVFIIFKVQFNFKYCFVRNTFNKLLHKEKKVERDEKE